MEADTVQEGGKRILFLYFSFSSQTKNLLHAMSEGMQRYLVTVEWERIEPVEPLHFPIGTVARTVRMMVLTALRQRIPIRELSGKCFQEYDLIILAGPTWSYNPSGPVLSLFDRDGERLFRGKKVLPLISCRGYWRMHWWGLRALLRKCGALVDNLIVFTHPNPEPWRTLGVFLKLAGRVPERHSWISRYYQKYGHTRDQLAEARRFGEMIALALEQGGDLGELDFRTSEAMP